MLNSLTEIKHLILDMDGVLYLGSEPMPRLRKFFAFLRKRSIPFILVTCNATHTPSERSIPPGTGYHGDPDSIIDSHLFGHWMQLAG